MNITPRTRGFTLVELLVVMGLIGTLMSLLLPVVGRTRSAARATACLSNLRQMGTAFTMYTAESRGRLMPYVWSSPATPDVAWTGYWPGALEAYAIRGDVLLCPAADEITGIPMGRGYGNADHAWTGKYGSNGSGIKMNPLHYRQGSYGFNRWLTAGAYTDDGLTTSITHVRNLSDVPLFVDCAYPDVRPDNGTENFPVSKPPDLRGNVVPGSPEHWKFLLARHGRGINAAMADGSARYIPLEDLYQVNWKGEWSKYRLSLPSH